jgi:protein-S-isoprenylcysteine O-methyltransferase Ste14
MARVEPVSLANRHYARMDSRSRIPPSRLSPAIAFFCGIIVFLLVSLGLHLVDADEWPWYVESLVGALVFATALVILMWVTRRPHA